MEVFDADPGLHEVPGVFGVPRAEKIIREHLAEKLDVPTTEPVEIALAAVCDTRQV
jgi:hypothetical protein